MPLNPILTARFRHLLMIALALFANAAGAGAPSEFERQIGSQLLVHLKSTGSRGANAALLALLPPGSRIVASSGRLRVVALPRAVRDDDFFALVRSPEIAHVERDRALTRQSPPNLGCAPSPAGRPVNLNEALGDATRALRARLGTGSCQVFDVCAKSGRSRLWAQQSMDSDLAAKEAESLGIRAGDVKVAVIDDGFSPALQSQMARPVKVIEYPDAKARSQDDWHGSAAASAIGGAGGVGVAPLAHVSLYRTPQVSRDGQVSMGALQALVSTACDEGNEIINLSWGSRDEESGKSNDLSDEFIRSLAERGCVVVKAAGNNGYKQSHANDDLDDAYLRVDATSPVGGLAKFSSVGEVSAPGEGVFALVSPNPGEMKPSGCTQNSGDFVSGTSFAAPLTAGVRAYVLAALKKNPVYAKLAKSAQIALANRIVAASKRGGSINQLRALRIASNWIRAGKAEVPGVPALAASLRQQPAPECVVPPKAPALEAACSDQERFVSAARRAATLCEPPNGDLITKLSESYLDSGNFDLSAMLMRSAREIPNFKLPERAKQPLRDLIEDPKSPASAAQRIDYYSVYRDVMGERIPEIERRMSEDAKREIALAGGRDPVGAAAASARLDATIPSMINAGLFDRGLAGDLLASPDTRSHALVFLPRQLGESRAIISAASEILADLWANTRSAPCDSAAVEAILLAIADAKQPFSDVGPILEDLLQRCPAGRVPALVGNAAATSVSRIPNRSEILSRALHARKGGPSSTVHELADRLGNRGPQSNPILPGYERDALLALIDSAHRAPGACAAIANIFFRITDSLSGAGEVVSRLVDCLEQDKGFAKLDSDEQSQRWLIVFRFVVTLQPSKEDRPSMTAKILSSPKLSESLLKRLYLLIGTPAQMTESLRETRELVTLSKTVRVEILRQFLARGNLPKDLRREIEASIAALK